MLAILKDMDIEMTKRFIGLFMVCSSPLSSNGNTNGDSSNIREGPIIEELDSGDDDYVTSSEHDTGKNDELMVCARHATLAAAVLLGLPELGGWILGEGWSSSSRGNMTTELGTLAASGSHAFLAGEVVSAGASVEKARPRVVSLAGSGGVLASLLAGNDAGARSGAASAMAKLGLAAVKGKGESASDEEDDILGLLEVASGLLEEVLGLDEFDDEVVRTDVGMGTTEYLAGNSSSSSTDIGVIQRGLEVLGYLATKTIIKNEIAKGYHHPVSTHSVLQRLVELSERMSMEQQTSTTKSYTITKDDGTDSYVIASIFSSLTVSLETLRREAFAGKDISVEQYDQLQALGKTEEEKEFGGNNVGMDSEESVLERIRLMAASDVPRALVRLMDMSGCSEATREQAIISMSRMANDKSSRGVMIQQGCLSACIKLTRGVSERISLFSCCRCCTNHNFYQNVIYIYH